MLGVALITIVVVGYAIHAAFDFQKTAAKSYNDQLATALNFDTSVPFDFERPIEVAQIVDGDTVRLMNGDYVRYAGIEAPRGAECYGREAAAKNAALVSGKSITVYKDVSEKDASGHWLGYAYLPDGTFVNDELVRGGYARASSQEPNFAKADTLADDEATARSLGLGLWSHCR
jgi:endonuclease YncB( thermonuclease family)